MVKELKGVILGDFNVGKTTILKKIMKLPIYNISATIGLDIQRYHHQDVSINFWDTSGQERFNAINKNYIKNSNIVLLVFDINKYETFLKINDYWIQECEKYLCSENTFYFVIGNKMDIFPNHPTHRYNLELKKNYKLYFISATNDNLEQLLLDIYKQSLELETNKDSNLSLNNIIIPKKKCCN
jgi:small GTP-binding protein